MPSRNRKKRSKQQAEYLQKQDGILSQENKAKARKKEGLCTDSYKADPEKKKASVRDSYKADLYATATRPIPKRRRPLNNGSPPTTVYEFHSSC